MTKKRKITEHYCDLHKNILIDNIDQEEDLRALIDDFKKDYETKDDQKKIMKTDTSSDQNNTGATLTDQKKPGKSNAVANGNNSEVP